MQKVQVEADGVGVLRVTIGAVKCGSFAALERESDRLSWFPSNTDRLSGDDIIAIGNALNAQNALLGLAAG